MAAAAEGEGPTNPSPLPGGEEMPIPGRPGTPMTTFPDWRDRYVAASRAISCRTNGLTTLCTAQMQNWCKYGFPSFMASSGNYKKQIGWNMFLK
jgi:hypothetical protein